MKAICGRLEGCCLAFVALTIASLIGLSALFFSLNFEGKNEFQPYVSDRFELPFPSLFKEFELDNPHALKSGVKITRGKPEICWRRVAPEYEAFTTTRQGYAEHVPRKNFVVGGDMPPGWMSYTAVDVALLFILDGGRLDYVVHDPNLKPDEQRGLFTNHLNVFHEYLENEDTRKNTRLFHMVAPVPTFTVYALKTTFTGESRRGRMIGQANNVMMIEIDNIGKQLFNSGDKICAAGDVACSDLFGPEKLFIDYTDTSTDIFDMERPDNTIYAHNQELIEKCDVSTFHLVAVDHLGHNGRRLTSTMSHYLDKYDVLFREALQNFSNQKNRMLLAFGDHGQKSSGSHGGSSKEEVDSFLFVNSDLELMETSQMQCECDDKPMGYAKYHSVLSGREKLSYPLHKNHHINLAPTFSLLKNRPIPFHGEGSLIREMIPLIKDSEGKVSEELSLKYLAQMLHITAHKTMRTLDTTLTTADMARYYRIYYEAKRERKVLANYYSYIRSMGPNQLNLDEMKQLYGAYIKQCDRYLSATRRLLTFTNMTMTPEYMVTSIFVIAMAACISFYLFLAAMRLYHVNHINENERALFEAQKFQSICRIFFRVFWKLVASLLATFAIAKHIKYIDDKHYHLKLLGHEVETSIFKKIILPLEKMLGVEEEIFWFHPVCYAAIIFYFLFLFDIPFLIRGYRLIYEEDSQTKREMEPALPKGEFEPRISEIVSKMFYYDPVWMISLIYLLTLFLIITSQCAIMSHDMIARHIFVASLYLAIGPLLKQVASLRYSGIHWNIAILLLIVKTTYLVHPYIERRDIGKMIDPWYAKVKDLMRTFEVSTVIVTIFYVIQMKLISETKKQDEQTEVNTPLKALRIALVSPVFLRISSTLVYLALVTHYLFKSELHYFLDDQLNELSLYLTGLEKVQEAKNLLSAMTARVCGALVALIWAALAITPWGFICPPKGSPHGRSSILFWSILNMTWASLLINGPKKAIGTCVLGIMLYNLTCVILKARIRRRITCFALFTYICDMMYYVIGNRDSLFELDFDSAFVFVETYQDWISEITVFFAFSITNISTFCSIYYLFLLEGEKSYVSLQQHGEVNTLEHGPPRAMNKFSTVNMKAVVQTKMLRDVAEYTLLAVLQIMAIVFLLFGLSNNQCAVTDMYPKGLFTFGKLIVNTICLWTLFCAC